MFEYNTNGFFANNGHAPSTPSQPPVSPFHAAAYQQQTEERPANTAPETPAQQPAFAAAAPEAPVEHDSNFIEGWDDDEEEEFCSQRVNIKVFGVGGGGNNAVNRMYMNGDKSATLVAVNTDIRVLRSSPLECKIAIGKHTTKGHGAGANPESGKKAAEESIEYIKRNLEGVDMLYITAGMGGGTGTGASPIIAKVAKEMGILTVAVVTKPFECEGESRMATAEDGINKLRDCVDALIVVPNERLNSISGKELQISEAFEAADEILIKGVQSICRLINEDSYINLDFADLTTILKNSGDAHIGIGIASGDNKAMLAAEQAISSPLLETSIKDADGMIVSIISSDKVALSAITEATNKIRKEAAPNVNLILGLKFDPEMGDNIEITVIATRSGGLREQSAPARPIIENAEAPIAPAPSAVPNDAVQRPSDPFKLPNIDIKADPLYGDDEFRLIQNIATKRNEK